MSEKFNIRSVRVKSLVGSLAVAFAAGMISRVISGDIAAVYRRLDKPFFAPPVWLFPVAWGILYLMMGVACYMVYESRSPLRKKALTAYGIQLVLNSLWTFIFFKLEMFLFALIWLGLITAGAAVSAFYFYKVKKLAGYLLVPYIVWLCFAFVLNAAMYYLN
jgi:tryptophan-rich sensory protein